MLGCPENDDPQNQDLENEANEGQENTDTLDPRNLCFLLGLLVALNSGSYLLHKHYWNLGEMLGGKIVSPMKLFANTSFEIERLQPLL